MVKEMINLLVTLNKMYGSIARGEESFQEIEKEDSK